MSALKYILEVIICSGLFTVFYRWLLARKVSFRICRIYILTTVVLAIAIPAMNVPMYNSRSVSDEIFETITLAGAAETDYAAANQPEITEDEAFNTSVTTNETSRTQNIDYILWIKRGLFSIYIVTAMASLILIIINWRKIIRLRRRSRLTHTKEYTLAENNEIATPFSFLRTIFIGLNYIAQEREQILTHEASHIRHGHSYERVALSLIRSVFWFNPFFWMAESDLEEVQKWEADKDVLAEGHNLKVYRTTIFKQLFGYNPEISCGLNNSLTKQRFIMMTQNQNGRGTLLRLAATLPVITAVFLAFGCGTKEAKASNDLSKNLTNGTEATYLPMCPPCKATIRNSFGAGSSHSGIDYVLNEGDPIYAAADGEILSITRDNGNGLMLVLKHDDGIETRYSHLSKIQIVSHLKIEGSGMKVNNTYNLITDADHSDQKISGKVNGGQLIGYAGSTGRATGAHLHFEVRKDGTPVDPAEMFTSDKPATAPFPIYVVEGTTKPGEEYFAICNGKLCRINGEISEAVSRYFAETEDLQYATIQLEADENIPAEVLAKVSEQLRNVQALKVSKTVTEARPGETIVLSDATATVKPESVLIDVITEQNENRIYIDGVRHSLDEVAEVIRTKKESSEKPFEFTVQIRASKDTRMGIISDIKKQLREAQALRIRYLSNEGDVNTFLPPVVQPWDNRLIEQTLPENVSLDDLIIIRINEQGKVLMFGDDGETYISDTEDFNTDALKRIITNPDNKSDLPGKLTREIRMPDGSVWNATVSKAIISLQANEATKQEDFVLLERKIRQAYAELRNELSMEKFGKKMNALSPEETQVIYEAIPINVSEIEPKPKIKS